jgi:hypothetical protein
MLSYRTRHGSSPSGKPRIFFTAHPEEQKALLEDVSRDVLAIINAAIWYDDEPKRDISEDGEFFDSLGDMTLMIIAVTPRLLREPGRALGSELAFAKDNHIPILPIVCERIDDALYTKRLGELQYLERCSKDQTAIAYVEKLTRHLSSTLTDDTLADKVRAAQERGSRAEANALSVKLELQADCYAGVWAHSADTVRHFIEPGDIDEALNAASAVGDDTIQKRIQGNVNQETFTHGTGAQRQQWFRKGYASGLVQDCNTFQ